MAQMTLKTMIKLISVRPETCYSANPYHHNEVEERDRYRRRAEDKIEAAARAAIGKKFGRDIAKFLKAPDRAAAEISEAHERARTIISMAENQATNICADVKRQQDELCRAIGMPASSSIYDIRKKIHDLRDRITTTGEIVAVRAALKRVRMALDDAEFRLLSPEKTEKAA
jgi:vacuolar-type H+-ATPase subunit H